MGAQIALFILAVLAGLPLAIAGATKALPAPPAGAPAVSSAAASAQTFPQASGQTPESRMKIADGLEKKFNWAGVIEILRPAADTLPRAGLLQLARAYGGQHDYLNQVRALEILSGKTEKDYYVLSVLGEAYARKAELSEPASRKTDRESAAENFRLAIAANKDFLPAYEGLEKVLDRIGDRFEERSLIEEMQKKFGARPGVAAALLASECRLYSLDGYIQKALEICKEAIAADPKSVDSAVYLGLSMKDKEESLQAQKILDKAAEQFPASDFAQWAAGQDAYDRKSFAASYKYFSQGTKADPQSSRSWLGRGKAALELSQYDDSLTGYKQACAFDRQTMPELRKAAGLLRQKKLFDVSARFEQSMGSCGTKQAGK